MCATPYLRTNSVFDPLLCGALSVKILHYQVLRDSPGGATLCNKMGELAQTRLAYTVNCHLRVCHDCSCGCDRCLSPITCSRAGARISLPGQVVEESDDEYEDGVASSSVAVEIPWRHERSANTREAIDGHQHHHPDGNCLTQRTINVNYLIRSQNTGG